MIDTFAGYAIGLLTTSLFLAVTADPNLLLNILALASVLGVAVAIFRSGGFGVVRQANEELRRHKEEADQKIRELIQMVSLLETKTSLEPMVAAVVEQFEAHEQRAQARHTANEARQAADEERAQERHEAQIAVMSGFAANLERLARKETP